MQIRAAGQTDIGKVRMANEDAFTIRELCFEQQLSRQLEWVVRVGDRGVLLAVVDGGGGNIAGPVAAAVTLETLEEELSRQPAPVDFPELMERAVKLANKKLKTLDEEPDLGGIDAQLIAVLICDSRAFIASLGAARVYLIRGDRISQLTQDHNRTKAIEDKTPLPLLGIQPDINIGLRIVELRNRDVFVLCSDALHGHKVSEPEILDAVNDAPSYALACKRLVDMVNARGGHDNVTIVIGQIEGGELSPPSPSESVESTITVLKEFG